MEKIKLEILQSGIQGSDMPNKKAGSLAAAGSQFPVGNRRYLTLNPCALLPSPVLTYTFLPSAPNHQASFACSACTGINT